MSKIFTRIHIDQRHYNTENLLDIITKVASSLSSENILNDTMYQTALSKEDALKKTVRFDNVETIKNHFFDKIHKASKDNFTNVESYTLWCDNTTFGISSNPFSYDKYIYLKFECYCKDKLESFIKKFLIDIDYKLIFISFESPNYDNPLWIYSRL